MSLFSWFRRRDAAPTNTLERRMEAARHGPLPYRLSKPAKEGPHPLIVYLHGAGGAGDDNRVQLQRGNGLALTRLLDSPEPCNLLAPQCPRHAAWWSSTDRPAPHAERLMDLLDALAPSIETSRVYLIGPSMGGHGVWDLGWRFPERWAALVPICGAAPLSRIPALVATPVWAFHGADDTEVPVSLSRQAVQALRDAGAPVRYTELFGVGHSCTEKVFEHDILAWLLQQRRQHPCL